MKSLKVKLTSSLKLGRRNIFANVAGGGGGRGADLNRGGGVLSLSHLFIYSRKSWGAGVFRSAAPANFSLDRKSVLRFLKSSYLQFLSCVYESGRSKTSTNHS